MPTEKLENLKLENLLKSNENSQLGEIVSRARGFAELTRALTAALPEDVREGLVAAGISADGQLIVFGRSPAWAARLRYESSALLEAARDVGQPADGVRVRVSHLTTET